MASRRKQQNVVSVLDSSDGFAKAVEDSTRVLVVVDVHQNWTGPCTVMEPIYRKAYIELDRADERLKFYTVRGRVEFSARPQSARAPLPPLPPRPSSPPLPPARRTNAD